MLAWLFSKGIAGTISRDLMGMYLPAKSHYSEENEEQLMAHIWGLWLAQNEKHILSENNRDKTIRLHIIKEKKSGKNRFDTVLNKYQTLLGLYQDILYIETEISIQDRKAWHRAISTFLEIAQQNGLDFSDEYESYRRLLSP